MFEAFQVILGTHERLNEFSTEQTEGWSGEDKRNANDFMHCLSRFDFIIGMVSLYFLLHPIHGTTQKLQGRSQDILQAYIDIDEVMSKLKSMRSGIDKLFSKIYTQSCRVAEKMGVTPAKPRAPAQSKYRPNAPAKSIEGYFRQNIGIPLLDSIINSMELRFTDVAKQASKLLYLVPSMLISDDFSEDVLEDTISQYHDDIPKPDLVYLEIRNSRHLFLEMPKERVPQTISLAIKTVDKGHFPNVHTLLKLAATLPITSC